MITLRGWSTGFIREPSAGTTRIGRAEVLEDRPGKARGKLVFRGRGLPGRRSLEFPRDKGSLRVSGPCDGDPGGRGPQGVQGPRHGAARPHIRAHDRHGGSPCRRLRGRPQSELAGAGGPRTGTAGVRRRPAPGSSFRPDPFDGFQAQLERDRRCEEGRGKFRRRPAGRLCAGSPPAHLIGLRSGRRIREKVRLYGLGLGLGKLGYTDTQGGLLPVSWPRG